MAFETSIMMKLLVAVVVVVFMLMEHNAVEGRRRLSKDEDLELEQQLKILNKPFVKSIQLGSGDIFDCIDMYKQPAFDNPLLKNHKIQMEPNFILEETEEVSKAPSNIKLAKTELEVHSEGCPDGTVPIRRTKKEDLINSKQLYKPDSTYPFTPWDYNHVSLVVTDGKVHYGGKTIMNLWNPATNKDQFSTGQIWVQHGQADYLNSIEVGWTVYPQLNGDNRTRLFAYWTTDGGKANGCYNMLCPGFVQIDKSISLGGNFDKTSVYGGEQHGILVKVSRDPQTGNWWFMFNDENKKVGYWPKELFDALTENATVIKYGGVGGAASDQPAPPMGTGSLPGYRYRETAYMSNMKVVESNGASVDFDSDKTQISEDTITCYQLKFLGDGGPGMELGMTYGGPGGQHCW